MVRKLIKTNQRFIKHNLFSYFVIVFNLFASLYAVRENILVLHKELYGIWILVFSTVGILGMFHFGFSTIAIFKFNEYKEAGKLPSFFSNNLIVIVIQMLFTFFVFILLLYSSHLFVKEYRYIGIFNSLLIFAFPGVLFTVISSYLEAILYFNLKFIYHRNLLELLRLGVMNLLFVVGLYWYEDVHILPIIYSLVSFLAFLYTMQKFLSRQKIVIERLKLQPDYIVKNIHDSISFWVLGISSFVITQTDVFFISMIKNDLGLITMYSQSFRLQDIVLRFIKKITDIKGPKILSLLSAGNYKAVVNIYNKLLIINILLSVFSFLLIAFFGKFVLELWLNKMIEFDQTLITCLSLICITGSIHWVFWSFCIMAGHQKRVKYVVVVEIVFNLLFSYLFLNFFGLIGLGIASIISNSITIIYMYTLFRKYTYSV